MSPTNQYGIVISVRANNILVVWCRDYLRSTPLVNNIPIIHTSLQLRDDAQIDARQIIWASGHKNTDSLLNYARRLSAVTKRNISSILSYPNTNWFPGLYWKIQSQSFQVQKTRALYFPVQTWKSVISNLGDTDSSYSITYNCPRCRSRGSALPVGTWRRN